MLYWGNFNLVYPTQYKSLYGGILCNFPQLETAIWTLAGMIAGFLGMNIIINHMQVNWRRHSVFFSSLTQYLGFLILAPLILIVSWILPGETAAANSQSKCCSSNWLLQGCYYACEFLYTNLPSLACGHYWGKDFQLSVLFYLLQAMYTDNVLWYCSGQVDGDRPKAEVFTEIDKLLSELQERETNKVGATIAVRSL